MTAPDLRRQTFSRWHWIVAAATLAGAGLRIYDLGALSLWADETGTRLFIGLPAEQMWFIILSDGVNPPLFYLVERALGTFGLSEFGLRLPSALAGILSIPLMARLARAWTNRAASGLAAWLLALSPFAVWYAREARSYGLALGLTLAMAVLFARLVQRPTPARWLAFVLASAVAYLTHYFTTLFTLACALFLILRLRQDHRLFRRWMLAQAGAALLTGPWFLAWALHPIHSFGIEWIPRPGLADLPLTLLSLATGWNENWSLAVMVSAAVWLLGLGLSVLPGPHLAWASPRWRLLTLVWLIAPLLAVFIFSQTRPVYADRYFIVLLPPLILLAAAGLAPRRGAFGRQPAFLGDWRPAAAAVLLAALLLTDRAMLGSPAYVKEDWRAAASFLRARLRSPDEARLLILADLVSVRAYGLDLKAVGHAPEDLPPAFWLVVHDLRVSAHRFSAYPAPFGPADVPPLADWFARSPYDIREQQHFPGVLLLYVERRPEAGWRPAHERTAR